MGQQKSTLFNDDLRTQIYSYLTILEIINKVSKLSHSERNFISTSSLTQRRCLKIRFDSNVDIDNFDDLMFCLCLSSECMLDIKSFEKKDVLPFQIICSQFPEKLVLTKGYHNFELTAFDQMKRFIKYYKYTYQQLFQNAQLSLLNQNQMTKDFQDQEEQLIFGQSQKEQLFWKFKNLKKLYLTINQLPIFNFQIIEDNTVNVEDVYINFIGDFSNQVKGIEQIFKEIEIFKNLKVAQLEIVSAVEVIYDEIDYSDMINLEIVMLKFSIGLSFEIKKFKLKINLPFPNKEIEFQMYSPKANVNVTDLIEFVQENDFSIHLFEIEILKVVVNEKNENQDDDTYYLPKQFEIDKEVFFLQEIFEKNKQQTIFSIEQQLQDQSVSKIIQVEEVKDQKQKNFESGYLITYIKQDTDDQNLFKRLIIDTKKIFMTFGIFDMQMM